MQDTYDLIAIQIQYMKTTFRYLEDVFIQELDYLFNNYEV
jgi:hypothetical protein